MISIIPFQKSYQKETEKVFRSGLESYTYLSESIRMGQKWFMDDKLSETGDMFDIHASYIKDKTDSNFWLAIESDTGRLVGCVGCCPHPSDDLTRGRTCELQRMAVSPDARKSGIASKLIAALEEWAKSVGYTSIVLSTLDVMEPAVRLYTKNGYSFVRKEERDVSELLGMEPGSCIMGVVHYMKRTTIS